MSNSFNNIVFSWAENKDGRIVHVDDVPNGLNCECVCPCCKEPLVARHGEVKEHGFAHHSKDRGANLEICYMVVLYKLAEQIVHDKKIIRVPEYYGIYKEKILQFERVEIDNRYERDDKQPDIIAWTADNEEFIIEFNLDYKVQRKKDVDYHGVSCLQIDLSGQTFETLESFLTESTTKRRWVNNVNYFNGIVEIYKRNDKEVRIVEQKDCNQCSIKDTCCAVKFNRTDKIPIEVKNNGSFYRICKMRQYKETIKLKEEKKRTEIRKLDTATINDTCISNTEHTCKSCYLHLSWGDRNGKIKCSKHGMVSSDNAKSCKLFRTK